MMRSEGLRPRPWDPDYKWGPIVDSKWGPIPHSVRYEYKCPHCGKVNVRSGETRRLVCSYCGGSFWP